MRFVLDENADGRGVAVLQNNGHDAWTIKQAGLGGTDDAAVAVYAWDKDAIPIINDQEFAKRLRRADSLGNHVVYMDCKDTRLVEYLEQHLTALIGQLEAPPPGTFRIVRVKAEGCKIWHPEYLSG